MIEDHSVTLRNLDDACLQASKTWGWLHKWALQLQWTVLVGTTLELEELRGQLPPDCVVHQLGSPDNEVVLNTFLRQQLCAELAITVGLLCHASM